ncbi:hypothetical protein [Arthrobacter psychrochitiniphilus]|uniref:Uncharacterized protein n=1 Tax=Arthrobacter psychrochitiniphilus TaxID=291045 RepID=A0A2V3DP52_9MICC|nr:hypothetical protein [Arthrobacter psychrochitiniphilus]NYG17997.1 hypothetical protein [Arthrobacter psychrochitiniphilus]PXA64269.1 hypothetical protein CVS29_15995 [Arthrobacter psychrochitiniphilus]
MATVVLRLRLRLLNRGGAGLLSHSARTTLMRRSRNIDQEQRSKFDGLNVREGVAAHGISEVMTKAGIV